VDLDDDQIPHQLGPAIHEDKQEMTVVIERARGIMMRENDTQSLAPSMRAASISSPGTERKKLVYMKIAHRLTTWG